jgi:hypothetical protein
VKPSSLFSCETMDSSREQDLNLEDHLNKCRFCWRERLEDQKFIEITSAIEKRFFDLTQITVKAKFASL